MGASSTEISLYSRLRKEPGLFKSNENLMPGLDSVWCYEAAPEWCSSLKLQSAPTPPPPPAGWDIYYGTAEWNEFSSTNQPPWEESVGLCLSVLSTHRFNGFYHAQLLPQLWEPASLSGIQNTKHGHWKQHHGSKYIPVFTLLIKQTRYNVLISEL